MTWLQGIVGAVVIGAVVGGMVLDPTATSGILALTFQSGFLVMAVWRVGLISTRQKGTPGAARSSPLPRYTLLIALLDEASVVDQLVERLSEIDYPPDRLEAFLILEAHDHETIDAAWHADRPPWMSILIAPEGDPRTKPRALNHGLAQATGDLVTVYDAEDDPDPLQLREAAARFATDRTGALAALQAPLRIRTPARSASNFIDRQFAVEYAGLFEVTLPAMARLGLPFPLGGTSNHFRVDRLHAVGGWDAYNVTEDADLGFRLWRAGGRSGVLMRPTYEPPPGGLEVWLPQRTRWLKGFMQTFGVHSRSIAGLDWRAALSLTMTIAAPVVAAAVHAVSLAWVVATVLIALADGLRPEAPPFALSVLFLGTLSAWWNGWLGSKRAGLPYRVSDMLMAPAYWSLLTLAFGHAVWRLAVEPFAWDKTRHHPDAVELDVPASQPVEAGRRAA